MPTRDEEKNPSRAVMSGLEQARDNHTYPTGPPAPCRRVAELETYLGCQHQALSGMRGQKPLGGTSERMPKTRMVVMFLGGSVIGQAMKSR